MEYQDEMKARVQHVDAVIQDYMPKERQVLLSLCFQGTTPSLCLMDLGQMLSQAEKSGRMN